MNLFCRLRSGICPKPFKLLYEALSNNGRRVWDWMTGRGMTQLRRSWIWSDAWLPDPEIQDLTGPALMGLGLVIVLRSSFEPWELVQIAKQEIKPLSYKAFPLLMLVFTLPACLSFSLYFSIPSSAGLLFTPLNHITSTHSGRYHSKSAILLFYIL